MTECNACYLTNRQHDLVAQLLVSVRTDRPCETHRQENQ